ncbi:hypothetical protein R1T16_13455 [Flavobacterium sp. DG1-102-2]|uniref:hypothetical protein n=1 Tax=Flavobacterium sp. DG1-102-2 TaxID=3081663 RepID=UPI0029496C4F|nr:hypothetical protein [Flavobacterium sp. DG1-102-2]MDV6169436.1 hypothetical protein [Flavobacterium sp. DG1-102-2]
MKKLYYLPLLLAFIMCSSPKFEYNKSSYPIDTSTIKFLNTLKAKDSIYSALFFTDGFLSNEIIEVKNGNEIIFSDTLVTDRVLGLAEIIRVKNQQEILITDLKSKYSFKLPPKKNSKYKFIYISKDAESTKDYNIIYSNTLRGFY